MQLKWIKKVRADGMHNAFTGLTFFKGRYLLAFRSGVNHGHSAGRQVLMSSSDGEEWTVERETAFPPPPEVPPDTPIDARDNYFLEAREELMLYSFAHAPLLPDESARLIPSYSTVQRSRDGRAWSPPQRIASGVILWKPIFWRDQFWCAGYGRALGGVWLYRSVDGQEWERGGKIADGNETFLLPLGEDRLRAFVRTQVDPLHLEIWDSRSPFESWERVAVVPKIIQAPHVAHAWGRTYLFGREVAEARHLGEARQPYQSRTKVWVLNGTDAREVLELPSLGDTSYVGTALRPDGVLLVSYYSQHERELDAPLETRGGNNKPNDVFVAGLVEA